jgi:hypothetical protein
MKTNEQGKKIVVGVMIFMGIVFFMPVFMISSFDGFPFFALIPIIMFSMFGFFIFFAIKYANNSNNVKTHSMNYNNTDERHCTSCHEAIGVNHQFCPYCGVKQSEYVICDYCGQQNSKHDLMCKNCNGLLK